MEEIVRDIDRSFAHGRIQASVTLQGDGVENRQGVLDQITSALSEALSESLIPHFNRAFKKNQLFEKGDTGIVQDLNIQFLDTVLFLRFSVELYVEIPEDQKKSIECFLVEIVAPKVVSTGIQLVSRRLKNDYLPEADRPSGSPLDDLGGIHIPGVGIAIPVGMGTFDRAG